MTSPEPLDDELPLSPSEAAAVFRVHPVTITKWAKAGKLRAFRTPGGHRRFRLADIRAFLDKGEEGGGA